MSAAPPGGNGTISARVAMDSWAAPVRSARWLAVRERRLAICEKLTTNKPHSEPPGVTGTDCLRLRRCYLSSGSIGFLGPRAMIWLIEIHTLLGYRNGTETSPVFIAVAEEGHITRAAERLDIQQPPLSRLIQSIERELDVQLFRRRARGVELTDAGRAFLINARAVLAASRPRMLKRHGGLPEASKAASA